MTPVATADGSPPGDDCQFQQGDVRDPQSVAEALDGIDVVVHLAAQTGVIPSLENPLGDLDTNVRGLVTVLDGARRSRVRRVVFASSNAPLGEHEPPLHEGQVPRPLSPYGASKLAGEGFCSAFAASYGLETVALRFSNAYGPRSFRKGSVIALYCRQILAGEPLIIYGDGHQTRDFVHADDLAQAVVRGGIQPAAGGVYQIGTGVETTVEALTRDLAELARRDLGRAVTVRKELARAGEIVRNVSDAGRARRELEWQPAIPLERGLAETWAWFLERSRRS